MLTKYQVNLLEHAQKRALRAIYGYEKGYESLLQEAQLEKLEERRSKNQLKFAQNTLKNKNIPPNGFRLGK